MEKLINLSIGKFPMGTTLRFRVLSYFTPERDGH